MTGNATVPPLLASSNWTPFPIHAWASTSSSALMGTRVGFPDEGHGGRLWVPKGLCGVRSSGIEKWPGGRAEGLRRQGLDWK